MEQNVQTWSRTTKAIFTAVLIYSIGGIALGIFATLAETASVANMMQGGKGGTNFFTVLFWLSAIAVIVGYVMYIMGLGNMRSLVGLKEEKAITQVRTGVILVIIAVIFGMLNIKFVGWLIQGVLNIIGYIMMLVGFNTLRKSESMCEKAKKGFGRLFVSLLLLIIGTGIAIIFGWIPAIKYVFLFIAGVLNIIAFVMTITGWSAVKDSTAPIAE